MSKLITSMKLRRCINNIAICTKVSLCTGLVLTQTFGTVILENHRMPVVENYIAVKLICCIVAWEIFFFQIINYHFILNSSL